MIQPLIFTRKGPMKIALIHEHYNTEHLSAVKAEMLVMGAPVIRAVWMECYGVWAALEGCHRIRAAAALGLIPVIDEVEYSDDVVGGDDMGGDEWMISAICDQAYCAHIVEFDE